MSSRLNETLLIRIPIGDYTPHSPGKFDYFDFLVPSEFTEVVLSENYHKNKKLFGFGLSDFANTPGDSLLSSDRLEKLREFGFTPSDDFEYEIDASDEGGDAYLSSDYMFEIVIFYLGYGLDGFSYEMAREPDVWLFAVKNRPESTIGRGTV